MKPTAPNCYEIKAYSPKELAAFYGISPKIFRRWLAPHLSAIGPRQGHLFNVLQVQTILERLGVPGVWQEED